MELILDNTYSFVSVRKKNKLAETFAEKIEKIKFEISIFRINIYICKTISHILLYTIDSWAL